MSEAARRRGDARIFLVGLSFLAAAGFLGLHALATPGVLLERGNAGFTIATPVGLVVAGVFALASSLDLSGRFGEAVARRQRLLRGGSRPAPRRLGPRVARVAAAARRPAHARGGRGTAPRARVRRGRAVPRRRPALPRPLRAHALAAAARHPHRLGPARGGDAGDRLRPELAAVVVGVARLDGGRVRPRRRRRTGRAPQGRRRRPVRLALPRADDRARERRLRGGARAGRRAASARRGRRGAVRPERRTGRARQGRRRAHPPARPLRRAGRPPRRGGARGQHSLRRPRGVHEVRGDPAADRGDLDAERVLGLGRADRPRAARGHDRALRGRRRARRLQLARRPAGPCAPCGGSRARPPGADDRARAHATRLAALPGRREHGPGRGRLRRRRAAAELRRDRRHDQHGRPAPGGREARRGRDRRRDAGRDRRRRPRSKSCRRWRRRGSATPCRPSG